MCTYIGDNINVYDNENIIVMYNILHTLSSKYIVLQFGKNE